MSEQDRVGPYLEEVHLREQFLIYYQPIVSLETSKIRGFEALVRWQNPDHGFVSSAELIPAAEEIGLMVPIDWWVLGEACRQLRAWQVQFPINPPLTMSVNLSGRQFLRPRLLIKQIEQIIQETGLDPRSLNLEIPKNVLLKNIGTASATLSQLKALGVQLHLDNFGTNYSSVSYLHRLPINTLKIDRAFVSEMTKDSEHSKVVQASVTLAHNLSLDAIALGVETVEQVAQLKALKCKYGQGYLFSAPVDAKAVEALMTANVEAETALNQHFSAFNTLSQFEPEPEGETKRLGSVRLTHRAWSALAEIGKRQNKTISELLEEWALTGGPAANLATQSDD